MTVEDQAIEHLDKYQLGLEAAGKRFGHTEIEWIENVNGKFFIHLLDGKLKGPYFSLQSAQLQLS